MRKRTLALAAMLARPAAARALEPAVRAQLLGGQYFYAGQKGALSGNAAMTAVPLARLTDELTLVPILASSYQGTKQAIDLVGAGTLFQEQMEHRAALRALYEPAGSRWRLKPSVGYTYTLLKETKDESWGRGLFDSWRLGAGLEAEYPYREGLDFRLGVDYYHTAFPNFVSLESQAGLDEAGRPLARELAGRRTLNHHSLGASAAAILLAGRLLLEGRLREQRSTFPEQHVVDGTGALSEGTREDFLTTVALSARMPAETNTDRRLLGSFDLGFGLNASDQASYDARRARYLPGYYDYVDVRAGAGARWLLGDPREPVVASTALAWSRRAYPHRPTQDPAGTYRGGELRQDMRTLTAGVSYPLAPRFELLFRWEHAWSTSNQDYEQVYAYNYTVTNFLFGVSYAY